MEDAVNPGGLALEGKYSNLRGQTDGGGLPFPGITQTWLSLFVAAWSYGP